MPGMLLDLGIAVPDPDVIPGILFTISFQDEGTEEPFVNELVAFDKAEEPNSPISPHDPKLGNPPEDE